MPVRLPDRMGRKKNDASFLHPAAAALLAPRLGTLLPPVAQAAMPAARTKTATPTTCRTAFRGRSKKRSHGSRGLSMAPGRAGPVAVSSIRRSGPAIRRDPVRSARLPWD